MLNQTVASLAPFALILAATACGGASSPTTTEDEQGTPQANSADISGDGVASLSGEEALLSGEEAWSRAVGPSACVAVGSAGDGPLAGVGLAVSGSWEGARSTRA
jgi:hypothetical protein